MLSKIPHAQLHLREDNNTDQSSSKTASLLRSSVAQSDYSKANPTPLQSFKTSILLVFDKSNMVQLQSS